MSCRRALVLLASHSRHDEARWRSTQQTAQEERRCTAPRRCGYPQRCCCALSDHAVPPAVLCCAVLQDLLAKCGYVPGEDVVLSVGDLVNKASRSESHLPACAPLARLCSALTSSSAHLPPTTPPLSLQGPDSLAVLRWFVEGGPLVRAVRGNHEEAALTNYRNFK